MRKYSVIIGLIIAIISPKALAITWGEPQVVDDSGWVGEFPSLAFDPITGKPCIAYYDYSNGALKYAWFDNEWNTTVVDSGNGADVGWDCALAFDPITGQPHISYYDYTNGDLKHAWYVEGEGWQSETIDGQEGEDVGEYTSIAVGPDHTVYIAYYDYTNGRLKLARSLTGGDWELDVIDEAEDVGWDTSIALGGDGQIYISYYDYRGGWLKIAHFDGQNWNVDVVDDGSPEGDNVGYYSSIALDPATGKPRISYYNVSAQTLRYAWQGEDNWYIEEIDSQGAGSFGTSLVIDPDSNQPMIAYCDGSAEKLKFAYYSEDVGNWVIQYVDETPGAGLYPSLKLTPQYNFPSIAYYDDTDKRLLYVEGSKEIPWLKVKPEAVSLELPWGEEQPAYQSLQSVTLGVASTAEGGTVDYTVKIGAAEFLPAEGNFAEAAGEQAHIILQTYGAVTEKEQAMLEKIGVKLEGYAQRGAFYATVPAAQLGELGKLGFVRALWNPSPEEKMTPGIAQGLVKPWARRTDGRVRVKVRFYGDVDFGRAREIVEDFGGEVISYKYEFGNVLEVAIYEEYLSSLAAADEVRFVWEVPAPFTSYNSNAAALSRVDIARSAMGVYGEGIALGIWDGGAVDATHEAFGGRVTVVDSVAVSAHATHVGGTMVASPPEPFTNARGMAPQAILYSYDWNNAQSEVADAVANYRILVANNSWGPLLGWHYVGGTGVEWQWWGDEGFGAYSADTSLWDEVVANNDVVVVFAAGNDRGEGPQEQPVAHYHGDGGEIYTDEHPLDGGEEGYGCMSTFASAKNVISVGAVKDDGTMWDFSNWGPTQDGRVKPDLVANGYELYSTLPNNSYGLLSGTSAAAPVVSGAAGLLMEKYRQIFGKNPSPAMVKVLLIEGADDLGNPGPDYSYGFGLLDLYDSMKLLEDKFVSTGSLNDGEEDVYSIYVPEGMDELRVTLVWTDVPGAPYSNPALVNDLDSYLVEPNGITEHRPWVLNPSSPSAPAYRGINTVDNVEQIVVEEPTAGLWELHIVGADVPAGPQEYAVVWNGVKIKWVGEIDIANEGGENAIVHNISVENGSSWVYVSESATDPYAYPSLPHVLAPGEHWKLYIHPNTATLTPGIYEDTLLLDWNAPAGATSPYAVPIRLVLFDKASACDLIVFGWNLISIPLQPIDSSPEYVFRDLVDGGNAITNNLFRFSMGTGYELYPTGFTALERGRGYWFFVTYPANFFLFGVGSQDDFWIPLDSGWNLIGHPFPAPVLLEDCFVYDGNTQYTFLDAVDMGLLQPQLFYFDNGYKILSPYGTGSDTYLRPWRGYWMYVAEDGISLIVPPP